MNLPCHYYFGQTKFTCVCSTDYFYGDKFGYQHFRLFVVIIHWRDRAA